MAGGCTWNPRYGIDAQSSFQISHSAISFSTLIQTSLMDITKARLAKKLWVAESWLF